MIQRLSSTRSECGGRSDLTCYNQRASRFPSPAEQKHGSRIVREKHSSMRIGSERLFAYCISVESVERPVGEKVVNHLRGRSIAATARADQWQLLRGQAMKAVLVPSRPKLQIRICCEDV